jgi:hypothetical protein
MPVAGIGYLGMVAIVGILLAACGGGSAASITASTSSSLSAASGRSSSCSRTFNIPDNLDLADSSGPGKSRFQLHIERLHPGSRRPTYRARLLWVPSVRLEPNPTRRKECDLWVGQGPAPTPQDLFRGVGDYRLRDLQIGLPHPTGVLGHPRVGERSGGGNRTWLASGKGSGSLPKE